MKRNETMQKKINRENYEISLKNLKIDVLKQINFCMLVYTNRIEKEIANSFLLNKNVR